MLKAIVVDDEAPARSELSFLLGETDRVQVVAEAANMIEALEKLNSHGADVLFIDINMPLANSTQLVDAFNKLDNPPAVILLSTYSSRDDNNFGITADDYLTKPIDLGKLNDVISKVEQIHESKS